MARKGENIYKRKDGRWEGRYKKGRKASGQLKYGYIYGKKYSDVKKELYTYSATYQDIIENQGESAMAYSEWVQKWLNARKSCLKPSTYSSYVYKLNKYVCPLLGNRPLNQLYKEDIQDLILQWEHQGFKVSTIHMHFQILKKSLSDAYSEGKILNNPCKGIILPKKHRSQPHALTKINQHTLETKVKEIPLYKGLPVLLALNSGLRIGEISALKWEDINLEKRTIHVHRTYQRIQDFNGMKKTKLVELSAKTEKSIRTIPMSLTVYKYLKKWKKKSSSPYVCSNKKEPSEPRLISYYFSKIRQACGLTTLHFHHLRHTFATRCIEASPDVASVSQLLGHASSKTTLDVYTDSFIEGQQRVINQMDKTK